MKLLILSLRLLRKELKSRELRLIFLAVMLAVTALSSLQIYTDRIARALTAQTAQLIGGDIVLRSTIPIPKNVLEEAKRYGLKTSEQMSIPTMLSYGDRFQLVNLKVIDDHYPLRGTIRTKTSAAQSDGITNTVPSTEEIWIDPRLFSALKIRLGEQATIGSATFKVTRLLTYEPDVSSNWLNIAPKVLIHQNAIDKTRVFQPQSRVQISASFSGEERSVARYLQWLKQQPSKSFEIIDAKENRPRLSEIMERANQYLYLVIMVCLIFSGVSISLAAFNFQQNQTLTSALLRCFGLTQNALLRVYFFQLLSLGIMAATLGVFLGWGLITLFENTVQQFIQIALPGTRVLPLILAWSSGILFLLVFAFPAFMNLKNIPIVHIFQRNIAKSAPMFGLYGFSGIFVIALLWIQTRDLYLTAYFSLGVVLTLAVLTSVSYFFVHLLKKIKRPLSSASLFGITNVLRYPSSSVLQITAFGLIVMLYGTLWAVRTDLIQAWMTQIPKDAPNFFLINIRDDQTQSIRNWLKNEAETEATLYPIFRGRLVSLNQTPILEAIPKEAHEHNVLRRELNLTRSNTLPEDNEILQGEWPPHTKIKKENEVPLISIEKSLSDNLGLKMGDVLGFQIGENRIEAKIHSIRSLEWNSFHPNFYVIFEEHALPEIPVSYLTSFHLKNEKLYVLGELLQRFPNVTIYDVDNLLQEARRLINQGIRIVEYLLIFTCFAGALVFIAAWRNALSEKLYQQKILIQLGASKHYLKKMWAAEFLCVGFMAGTIGTIASAMTSFILAQEIFHFPYFFNPALIVIGILGTCVISVTFGLWMTRSPRNAKSTVL